MSTRALLVGALVLAVLLAAAPALATGGGWTFNQISTLDYTEYGWGPPYDWVDGRIYMPDGTTLVPDGSLVQIIIGLDGADIVDPPDYFDDPANGGNGNGVIDGSEPLAVLAWFATGADPAAISGGTNVLAYGTLGFTGEFATSGGAVDWVGPAGSEPIVANGSLQDKLAWRAWNLTKEDLMKWGDYWNHPELGCSEIWYTDGREFGSHPNGGGGPDTGWWIGMPDMGPGDDIAMWVGFGAPIGAEVFDYYVNGNTLARSQNRLDNFLLWVCVPEPSTLLFVGSGLLLLAARGATKRARRAAE